VPEWRLQQQQAKAAEGRAQALEAKAAGPATKKVSATKPAVLLAGKRQAPSVRRHQSFKREKSFKEQKAEAVKGHVDFSGAQKLNAVKISMKQRQTAAANKEEAMKEERARRSAVQLDRSAGCKRCCCGTYPAAYAMNLPQGCAAMKRLSSMGFTINDLGRLRRSFDRIDTDRSGTIDRHEFFQAFDTKKSPFSKALFQLFDVGHNNYIDYEEYCNVLSLFCTYTQPDITKFCFDVFDDNLSGSIDERQFSRMIKSIADSGIGLAGMQPGEGTC
jgi:Ca2+-binding EF-hand superfamily protein